MFPSPQFTEVPCFSERIDWILDKQHPDGSSGLCYRDPFLIKDALSSTLAYILALKCWNVGDEHIRRDSKSNVTSPQNQNLELLKWTLITKALTALKDQHHPDHLSRLHSLTITSGLARTSFIAGNLIAAYSALRRPSLSLAVFLSAPPSSRTVFVWNTLIRSHTKNRLFSAALHIYKHLQRTGPPPDAFTFPSVLAACAELRDAAAGREAHERVSALGFASDLYIANSLINMYVRLGLLDDARKVFDGMPNRDVVSWNSMITGYSANGEWEKALEVYRHLRTSAAASVDCFTAESVLPAFAALGIVGEGRATHGLVYKIGIESDRFVSNVVIAMYSRFAGLMSDARRVFDTMVGRDAVSWNTVIDGYYQSGEFGMAFELFREMVIISKPDLFTITTVLRACCDMENLRMGSSVHGYIIRNGCRCDVAALNTLVTVYSKCGSLHMSRNVFDRMDYKDSVSWNLLMSGYVSWNCFDEAAELFRLMKESDEKPDSVTIITLLSLCSQLLYSGQGMAVHSDAVKRGLNLNVFVSNALLNMYSKCNRLDDALKEFEKMENRDMISWNTIISGCIHNGNCRLGFKLLSEMKVKGLELDMATVLGILPACSFLAAKRQGKEIHGCILKSSLECYIPIGNALIEMYSKCGSLDYAVRLFGHMNKKDVVTWTALVSAYGMYGQGEKALRTFEKMEETGIVLDHVAFIAVLYACSHAGLVEEGKVIFTRMDKDYKIVPRMEHYACMVDLLSRSGNLVEAEEFIKSMPVEPDISIWGALLSACHISGDFKMAECVADRIIALDSENTGYYVLASNVYASIGNWDMAGKIRRSMKSKKLKKDPGLSWIEIRNRVYVFGTGDQVVEQSEEIYQLLERLAALMFKEGYTPDRKFSLQNVEEEDKGYMLCTHSERLAIAFGLLNTKPGTPLQIMKNLRVCVDCHTATKLISKIVQREFLVRDANRFHLFKDGSCSCGDCW